MDVLVYVFGALVLVAAAAAAWLGVERTRLSTRAAMAERERDAAGAELERLRARAAEDTRVLSAAQTELATHKERLAALERQRTSDLAGLKSVYDEKVAAAERVLAEGERRLAAAKETFSAAAGEALKMSRDDFLALAKKAFEAERATGVAEMEKRRTAVDELIKPMAEALKRTEDKLTGLSKTSDDLRAETIGLVRALSRPEVRGRYGEIQLKRVAELAGMKGYCDFSEQESQRDGDGRVLRPDMIVQLPNERRIVVDAKTNTSAYLEGANARTPEEQAACLERFAGHVADQVVALSKKQYWANDPGAYDFVVMFMPGDQFLDAALARRPDLLERAAELNVIIASPSTLIGLLRAVAVGWREKRIEEQAKELFQLGRELHERAAVAFEHVGKLGESLEQAVKRYNGMVGSVETRLLPTLRKFEESGVKGGKEIPELPEVAVLPRQPMLLPDSP
ncbi:MAG: DNA recombination protein RmuC [Phycisphaerales bacterium]